jgi:hypothetical protein
MDDISLMQYLESTRYLKSKFKSVRPSPWDTETITKILPVQILLEPCYGTWRVANEAQIARHVNQIRMVDIGEQRCLSGCTLQHFGRIGCRVQSDHFEHNIRASRYRTSHELLTRLSQTIKTGYT